MTTFSNHVTELRSRYMSIHTNVSGMGCVGLTRVSAFNRYLYVWSPEPGRRVIRDKRISMFPIAPKSPAQKWSRMVHFGPRVTESFHLIIGYSRILKNYNPGYWIYIEDLNTNPAVKKAIILLLPRADIKVLKDALAH